MKLIKMKLMNDGTAVPNLWSTVNHKRRNRHTGKNNLFL